MAILRHPSNIFYAKTQMTQICVTRPQCVKSGVFNLSDIAGHINNFNDACGPQTYDVHVHIIGKSGRSVNLTKNRCIMCRQRAGLAFVVIFSKRPAVHAKGLRGPRVEDPWCRGKLSCCRV
jgi:hypothetical protein